MGACAGEHGFVSKGRNGINIDGVCDVLSFDESGISLETVCGNMAIEGEGLHVTVLNVGDGKIEVEGKINGVYYYDSRPKQKRGLFGIKND